TSIAVAAPATPLPREVTSAGEHRYEYVLPDGRMDVFDIDAGHRLVESVTLPTDDGVRGVVADPPSHSLYVSVGGDGGRNGNGVLLKYDLVAQRVVWTTRYPHGIDSMAVSKD